MELKFREFLEMNVPGRHLDRAMAAFVSGDTEGPKFIGRAYHLPDLDMIKIPVDIPLLTRKSKIVVVNEKSPQISVQLADNTKLVFTHDEFKRLNKVPQRDMVMTVTFQRRPGDKSQGYSQIQSCSVD